MGKTYRNFGEGESDKRNSRGAKKHSQIKRDEQKKQRAKMKREDWSDPEN